MRNRVAAAGVAAASLVVGVALTAGFGLSTGFERAARAADLADVVARFDVTEREDADRRVRALPNLAARSYRYEETRVGLRHRSLSTRQGVVHVVLGGRRGYAVVDGRDLSSRRGEVLVERGLAREWDLRVGDRLRVGRLGDLRVAGVALSPDNVAFPLAKTARVYVHEDEVAERLGFRVQPNLAQLWLADRERVDVTLAQARAVSFGVGRLRFVTRTGIAVLVEQAAGVVIALLLAFALVALIAAATMLASGAHAEVQRRLPDVGVRRALGFRVRDVTRGHALAAARVAAPAAAIGLAAGALVAAGPTGDLLAALNQQPAGAALLAPMAVAWLLVVCLVAGAAAWPAWRAARRPAADLLRGGDLTPPQRSARGGLLALGARFATAGRARYAASVLTLAVCGGVIVLMLGLAALLVRLRDDASLVGKRYAFTVDAPAYVLPSIRAVEEVAAAGERFATDAADAFRLDEPLRLVAYRGEPSRFEAPPLERGRRVRAADEVEVGRGLADVLGLRPGSRMAVQLPSGQELRLRVSGIVRALERDGRQAWMRAPGLLAAQPGLRPELVVRLEPGASREAVARRLRAIGAAPVAAGGATTRDAGFLGILASVLRAVAGAVGLVCLYALVQGLAMTARERRGAIALLRALGGGGRETALVLAGAAAAVAVPAAALAVALGQLAFAPLVGRLAAGYATLPVQAPAWQAAAAAAGLLVLAAAATLLVARRIAGEPIVAGLREP